MHLLTIGLTHRTAPIGVRERIALAPEQLLPSLHELVNLAPVTEASLLSTCNRTEMFIVVDDPDNPAPRNWFMQLNDAGSDLLAPLVHQLRGTQAARHLFRVASGLDSMILGEPQIFGQVKQSYETARQAGTVGKCLNQLYQQSFAAAKEVRTDTAIGNNPVSVAFAAATMSRRIFGDLDDACVLLVGAGETIELTARHLQKAGAKKFIVANRTVSRAEQLANEYSGEAISLSMLPDYLHRADVLITSTAADLPLIGKGAVERALKQRRHRPIFMADLAVPRDIEPEVSQLGDVYLYTIDDLQQVVQENMKSRQAAADEAELIVGERVRGFQEWLNGEQAVPLVKAYRGQIERTRDEQLQRAIKELTRGDDPERVLSRFAHGLTNKLSHDPLVAIRQAGRKGDLQALSAMRQLLNLEADTAKINFQADTTPDDRSDHES
ncbi:MAG: glutamyl-tRNA reductase [Immundisolibacteraceae bacterium]|nr:glutamyl-tRNA reductase [Immundisolibacteraceae bacterium]